MNKTGNKLKQLIGNYTSSTRPTSYCFGTMVTPTSVQLDNSQGPIPEQLVIIPEHLRSFKVQVEAEFHGEGHTGESTVDNSLKAGDRVIVLQNPGGQKYLILGRL